MKVGIGSIEVSDEFRKALRKSNGISGLASRAEVREWVEELLAQGKAEVIEGPPSAPEPPFETGDETQLSLSDE